VDTLLFKTQTQDIPWREWYEIGKDGDNEPESTRFHTVALTVASLRRVRAVARSTGSHEAAVDRTTKVSIKIDRQQEEEPPLRRDAAEHRVVPGMNRRNK
jgi:hypothetical protein